MRSLKSCRVNASIVERLRGAIVCSKRPLSLSNGKGVLSKRGVSGTPLPPPQRSNAEIKGGQTYEHDRPVPHASRNAWLRSMPNNAEHTSYILIILRSTAAQQGRFGASSNFCFLDGMPLPVEEAYSYERCSP